MKIKRILRFYFLADSLENAFDKLILYKACAPDADGLKTCERLCAVIGDKMHLERLWAYLDSVFELLTEEERVTLSAYSSRCALLKSDSREVKRAVIKFTRRARRIEEFGEELSVLGKYYSLMA